MTEGNKEQIGGVVKEGMGTDKYGRQTVREGISAATQEAQAARLVRVRVSEESASEAGRIMSQETTLVEALGASKKRPFWRKLMGIITR